MFVAAATTNLRSNWCLSNCPSTNYFETKLAQASATLISKQSQMIRHISC
jgi:hypothetical protein